MIPWPNLKELQLERKLAALRAWMDQWRKHVESPQGLPTHFAQVQAVMDIAGVYLFTAETDYQIAKLKGVVPQNSEGLEAKILAATQIWEFFRSKLGQRYDPALKSYLRAADELAWQCYLPARRAVYGDTSLCKEPPLVFLNGGWSPFVVERNREYQVESVPPEFLKNAEFSKAVAHLPFSVIGVPWYQTGFLPDALSIAHEVGHTVESDFDLTTMIQTLIAGAVANPDRRRVWLKWSEEIFADVYACICVGPAFAYQLSGFLAVENAEVMRPRFSGYPSRYLRVLFLADVITALGFPAAAGELRHSLRAQYPDPNPMVAYEDDLPHVARALVGKECKLGGKWIQDVIRFDQNDHLSATGHATRAVDNGALTSTNVRILFAAVGLAFQSRSSELIPAQDRLLNHIIAKACDNDRRSMEAKLPAAAEQQRTERWKREALAFYRGTPIDAQK